MTSTGEKFNGIGMTSTRTRTRMIERLRQNQRIRETFGRYIDPRIAEGLLDQSEGAVTEASEVRRRNS